jgi:glycosyltransferase involved in cell wall biosynthesis
VALAAVSLVPGLADILEEMFDLGSFQFGRLLALLLVATTLALFLALYTKAKHDTLKRQVDRVFCAWAADELLPADAASRMKPITVIMPALNEARNLEKILPRMPAVIGDHEVGVLVVDDGSDDDTAAVALRLGAVVARNPVNRGQGAAQRVGYRVLQRHGIELGVTMDSDNQHRPEDLTAMIQPVLDRRYDLVIGSRVLGSHDGGSSVRVTGVHLLSRVLTAVTGVKITDCSSGFKAFRMSQMNKIILTEDQYQASEVLIRAAKGKLKIGEVPIHIAAREFGTSRKGHDFLYGFFYVKAMVKAWLS